MCTGIGIANRTVLSCPDDLAADNDDSAYGYLTSCCSFRSLLQRNLHENGIPSAHSLPLDC